MKLATDVPSKVMRDMLAEIRRSLWLDTNANGDFWNPDKEWSADTLQDIAGVLEQHGLRPDEEAPCEVDRSESSPVPDEVIISAERL